MIYAYGTLRRCRTCHRTHAKVKYELSKGREIDFDAFASQWCADLMTYHSPLPSPTNDVHDPTTPKPEGNQ